MASTSNKKGFISVQSRESYHGEQGSDDIPLTSARLTEPTGYHGPSIQPTSGAYQPVSRPRRRRLLHNLHGFGWLSLAGDLVLTMVPCIFLVLAFQASALNHFPISDAGKTVEQAAKLGPSIFPIVFAAVVGRLMRTFALWRAERGTTLGVLEQLNGSQNLLAALERAIMVPGLGVFSVALVALWALSPLGGQSALRVLSRGTIPVEGAATLYYFNNTGNEYNGAFVGASSFSTYRNSLDAVFKSTLASIDRTTTSDVWGNVRVPVLQYMPSYIANTGKDGWYDFDPQRYGAPYSALSGIVVSGLKQGMQTNFTIESSYFNLTCPDPETFNATLSDPEDETDESWGGFAAWVGTLALRQNASELFSLMPDSSSSSNSFMIDTNYVYDTANMTLPSPIYNFVYASRGTDNRGVIVAFNCSVGVTHVEVDILCKDLDCQARRVRPSLKVPPNTYGWPFPFQTFVPPYNFLNWMIMATAQARSNTISPIDAYVAGSNYPFSMNTGNEDTSANALYANVTGAKFAERLQSIVNTGWQLGFQLSATAQPPSTNVTALQLSMDELSASVFSDGVGYVVSQTDATTLIANEAWIANRPWIAVTCIATFILIGCGIASLFFKYGSSSPDILGFVSSMTRDNPNFEQIPGGDKLDGMQRARRMRDVKVQIADVKPWDDDGHIMLRSLERVR